MNSKEADRLIDEYNESQIGYDSVDVYINGVYFATTQFSGYNKNKD